MIQTNEFSSWDFFLKSHISECEDHIGITIKFTYTCIFAFKTQPYMTYVFY